ncbi:MAG TPA: GNAT family N-acetyltransferase [Cytophagales bacterium]|nr:GNAT family N-acetyltransferase [Cytophagales bacterium]HAP62298.1 GNAT family N-acetyltransferase [Cytophagales bacterium]
MTITLLNNTDKAVAEQLHTLFQVSYAVEAKLLGAKNFPPLQRPLEAYMEGRTRFYGAYADATLAGATEIEATPEYTYINSMVVHPQFFRRGIASQLMEYVMAEFDSPRFFVETGLDNGPATRLYLKFGFREILQWDTDHGVRKVKFEWVKGS